MINLSLTLSLFPSSLSPTFPSFQLTLHDILPLHLLCAAVWGVLVSIVAFTAWHDAWYVN